MEEEEKEEAALAQSGRKYAISTEGRGCTVFARPGDIRRGAPSY